MLGRLTEWLATSAQCEEAPEKVRFPLSQPAFFHSFLLDRVLSFLFWETFFLKRDARVVLVGRDPPTKMHHPVPRSFSFFIIRAALSKVSFAPLRVRSFVRMRWSSISPRYKREKEKRSEWWEKNEDVCIFSHHRELHTHTHVEEPTRERKKIMKK